MDKLSLTTRTYYFFKRVFTLFAITAYFLLPCNPFLAATYAQDKTDVKASVSGTINCVNTSVTLLGNSATPNARFTWTGPGSYKSTSRNAVTALPGEYTLKVIGAQGIVTSTVKVIVDTMPPSGVNAAVSGLLTCADTSVSLMGSSSTSGVKYQWKGANGYASTQQKPLVRNPGLYSLTVTNPANGCSAIANAEVGQNIIPPAGVTATSSGLLTCKTTNITLTGTSVTKGVIYSWSGPGFTSSLPKQEVNKPGKYTLKVTGTENGCNSTASILVQQNIREPAVTITTPDTITCKITKVTLKAVTSTKDVSYEWTGPNGFKSTRNSPETFLPGNYVLNVTDPENGCHSTTKVTVTGKKCPAKP